MADAASPTTSCDSPNMDPRLTLPGAAENLKLLYDQMLAGFRESVTDGRGWEALKLRTANNAATVDHIANIAATMGLQTGATENQSQVTPIRTAAADTLPQGLAGITYPPIRNVDQSAAVATGVNMTAMDAVAAGIAAINQTLVNVQAALAALLVASAGQGAASAAGNTPAGK